MGANFYTDAASGLHSLMDSGQGAEVEASTAMSFTRRAQIPIWQEGRVLVEHSALRRDPVLRGEGVPRGDGKPVLLIPGFMAGETSMGLMARWLRSLGYRPTRARIRANIDCSERALGRLEALLVSAVERHGRQASIVGHSRGGTMARVLAVRRPDLVRSIITLGSPIVDQFAVHPLVRVQVRGVATLGSLGVPGFFRHACRDGCCAEAHAQAEAPFPPDVRFTSVFSRSDGVVAWEACLDPAADHVEVRSSHVGMAVNPEVYKVIARALEPSAPERRVDPALTEVAA